MLRARSECFQYVVASSAKANDSDQILVYGALNHQLLTPGLVAGHIARSFFRVASEGTIGDLEHQNSRCCQFLCRKRCGKYPIGTEQEFKEAVSLDNQRVALTL